MTRTSNGGKLSIAWEKLHRLWRLDLNSKIEFSNKLLSESIKSNNAVICWSGGKDSTVVLHLARFLDKNIPVIFTDTGIEHRLTYQYINKLANEWNLNLIINTPEYNFWKIGEKYGWPIFGKNISSNVERAIRTGNIRPQLSYFEKILAENNVKISCMCSEILRVKPSKILERSLCATAKIVGIRADESRSRVRIWADYGDAYFVKRYYGRGKGIMKVNPIAIWTEKDIWDYHIKNSIPICGIYKKGYPRNGCWPCAMGIKNGQLKRLKENDIELYEQLYDSKMGKELIKIKQLLTKLNYNHGFDYSMF